MANRSNAVPSHGIASQRRLPGVLKPTHFCDGRVEVDHPKREAADTAIYTSHDPNIATFSFLPSWTPRFQVQRP